MPYKNRIRIPIMFAKPQFPVERNTFRLSNGQTKVLSMIIRNTYAGKTDQLPEDWHRKLVVALSHDTVTVEGERLLSDVVLDGDYGIDWQDFLNYPIAQADFNVQVTPFNATNSNCQTCEDMSQVVCVDDTTDDIWAEGTTHEFPDILTANDTICCTPYVVSLVTFNATLFSAVSISAGGILTATVQNVVPDLTHIKIATYRVTCSDGSYDEADVYGNVSGAGTLTCDPPVGPISITGLSATSVFADWDSIVPDPACGWIWELYLTADLGTIIQSGNVMISEVTITGLVENGDYTLVVYSDCCAYDYSTSIEVNFISHQSPESICGNFDITYIPSDSTPPQSISYMDCNGKIQNETLAFAQIISRCMLLSESASTTPLYFVASTSDIVINYTALC